MRLFTVLLIGILFPLFTFGQTKQISFQLAPKTAPETNTVKNLLKIAPDNTLKVIKQSNSYGIHHTRYEQYHEGHRIIGSSFVVHAKPENETTINGQWLSHFSRKGTTYISKEDAIQKAIQACPKDSRFYWEIPNLENQLQQSNSKRNTYYPSPKLVWYDKNFSASPQNYHLAYEMDVYVFQPLARYKMYIDAQSGELIHKYNNMHSTNVPATGTGFHNGDIEFVTDSISPNKFLLQEHKRNGHTNITTSHFFTEEIIEDANNQWTEAGEDENKTAIDVHWGIEKTIDYYHNVFSRQGMDNQGRDVKANVHLSDANAYYDGESINFGDGNTSQGIKALTPLVIVAHEFTHGVTESEANLIYEGESGAINESVSDIFGATIEHAFRPATFNWTLGEEIDYVFRKMDDPKSVNQPSTYGGENWNADGDVHESSAIGNLWYFLIVEGGTGTNDNDYSYSVQGIGFEKAQTIVYEALTNYLTESSDYQNFRDVTLEITNNLYGGCGSEYYAVANAWRAVGVGDALRNNDLKIVEISAPQTSCGLALEPIDVKLKYNSCPDSLLPGSTIKMYYSINGGTPISEDYVTTETLYNEQSFHYIFNTKADLSSGIDYEIKVWHENPNDSYEPNNVAISDIKNRSNIPQDLALVSLDNISFTQCDNTINPIKIGIKHIGCESLAAGSTIPVELSLGSSLTENIILTTTDILMDGDSAIFEITPTLSYGSTTGDATFNVKLKFPNDPDQSNDINTKELSFFEAPNTIDPFYFSNNNDINRLHVRRGEFVKPSFYPLELIERNSPSDKALLISGGEYYGFDGPKFEEPESADQVWDINKEFISDICICIDATTWDSVILDFDMQQAYSDLYGLIGLDDPTLFCNMRLKVDGTVVSPTYRPDIDTVLFHHEHYVLNQYAGSVFSLCFETQNIIPTSFGSTGDELQLDNIFVTSHTLVGNNNLPSDQFKVLAFPNPVKNNLEIQVTLNGSQETNYSLFNTSGQVLLAGQFRAIGHHSEMIDLSGIAIGVYYLKVQSDLGSKVIRVVKAL